MKTSGGKKGDVYGITVKLKRDLTPEETEHLSKVLDVTDSSIRLFLNDDVAANKPEKPPARPKQ
ncbi:MAG: hypothetical protein ABSH50_06500 [Bryobacteraceae bacterium]|jgi:hypothetical protein